MYTRCPHCLTVFVVAAEQLKAAHGNVRCGTCLESFDAIPHLSDGPAQMPSEALIHNDGLDDGADPGDSRIASEQLTSTLDAVRTATSTEQDYAAATAPAAGLESDGSAFAADADAGGARDVPLDGNPDPAPRPAHHGDDDTGSRVSVVEKSTRKIDDPLPDVLREHVEELAARNAARRRNIGYGVAALALLVLLAGQYVFFMPEDATRRYPQWRGAIESLCVQVGCVLPERRDPGRIRVVSRDVRVHPRLEGVMQIKATLTNSAPYRQPYPQVQFTLFNVNGQTIATRVFQPSEYLGRRIAASARLRPQTPFQVELDVLAPEEAAVSFEFSFL